MRNTTLAAALGSFIVIGCGGDPGANGRLETPDVYAHAPVPLVGNQANQLVDTIADATASAALTGCLATLADVQGADQLPDNYPERVQAYMVANAIPGCVPAVMTTHKIGSTTVYGLEGLGVDCVTYPPRPEARVCQALDTLKTACDYSTTRSLDTVTEHTYAQTVDTLSQACDTLRGENLINYSCITSVPQSPLPSYCK